MVFLYESICVQLDRFCRDELFFELAFELSLTLRLPNLKFNF